MITETSKYIKVTLNKSLIGRLKKHKACVNGLGLKKIGDSRTVLNTAENRGMINKVNYLLLTENVADA